MTCHALFDPDWLLSHMNSKLQWLTEQLIYKWFSVLNFNINLQASKQLPALCMVPQYNHQERMDAQVIWTGPSGKGCAAKIGKDIPMMLQGKGRESWLCVHVSGQKTAAEECLGISILMNGSWGWEQWFWAAAARL